MPLRASTCNACARSLVRPLEPPITPRGMAWAANATMGQGPQGLGSKTEALQHVLLALAGFAEQHLERSRAAQMAQEGWQRQLAPSGLAWVSEQAPSTRTAAVTFAVSVQKIRGGCIVT